MPLIDFTKIDNHTKIITWEVSESNEELLDFLQLKSYRIQKYINLSDKRKREYLGLRACMKTLYLDEDVLYQKDGRPYIETNHHISISHSHGLVSVGVSDFKIGIDIEKNRPDKIKNIKYKFVREDEDFFKSFPNESDYLHIIWGIKEGLYKLHDGNLWSFTHHYKVEPFDIQSNTAINSWVTNEIVSEKYYSYYRRIQNYFLIYVLDYEAQKQFYK